MQQVVELPILRRVQAAHDCTSHPSRSYTPSIPPPPPGLFHPGGRDSEKNNILTYTYAHKQYTYLLTVPLIMAYCFGFTYMKYKEGWIVVGGTAGALRSFFSFRIYKNLLLTNLLTRMWIPANSQLNSLYCVCWYIMDTECRDAGDWIGLDWT